MPQDKAAAELEKIRPAEERKKELIEEARRDFDRIRECGLVRD